MNWLLDLGVDMQAISTVAVLIILLVVMVVGIAWLDYKDSADMRAMEDWLKGGTNE